MPSQTQTIQRVVLYDYETANGSALANVGVTVQLVSPSATPTVASSPTSQVPADQTQLKDTTDNNGYWEVSVPSNAIITPAGSYYLVVTPNRSLRVAIPSGAGPFQASANPAP
jgi:hypothetical protein